MTERPHRAVCRLQTDDAKEHLCTEDPLHRALYDNAPDGILLANTEDRRFADANASFCRMTGYSREEILDLGVTELHPEKDLPEVLRQFEKQAKGEISLAENIPVMRKDGSVFYCDVNSFLVPFSEPPLLAGIFRDITQRRDAERSLRSSEEMLSRAQSVANIGSWTLDFASQQVVLSKQLRRIYGVDDGSSDMPLEALLKAIVHPDDIDRLKRGVQDILSKETVDTVEFRIVHKDGTMRIVSAYGDMLYDANGKAIGTLGIVKDITEQRALEQKLLDISSQEKSEIAGLLHDSLGQELAGTALLAKALERRLRSKALPEADDANRIAEIVGSSLLLVRRLTRGLLPVEAVAEGLASALRALAARTRDLYGISCRCTILDSALVHDPHLADQVYYIAQEAVANAARHSAATQINIRLRANRVTSRLTVSDNGKGFIPSANGRPGMGLRLMHYRAAMVGANLAIKSKGSRRPGTTITCVFKNRPAPTED